ncbi:MAG: Ig-like domain-containing protein, partial [Muribaculaceae bacterium]|nr:Ig-like domain-containing protein [Muribaculaceae bacterium]
FYINGPAYAGIMDAIAWYSDHPNDIQIVGDSNGANVVITQYFTGTATIECQYAYHYYSGSKKENQTGHASIIISCKASTVSLSQEELTLSPGESISLSYTNSSGYEIPYPYWKVDDNKIVTIDGYDTSTEKKITVKGINPGSTTITFYANAGKENPTCRVTVKDIPAKSISLSPSTLYVNEGRSARFSVEYTPKDATSPIAWSIGDESIASISSGGSITGLKEGTTTVTATTNNGLTATGTVKVVPQPTDIKLPISLTLYKGYNTTLEPTLTPSTATTSYKWRSDSSKVVSVDEAGNIYAKSVGSAIISVTTENGKTASTTITVREPEEDLDYRNISKRVEVINDLLNETLKIMK